jgi:hypothetical protein
MAGLGLCGVNSHTPRNEVFRIFRLQLTVRDTSSREDLAEESKVLGISSSEVASRQNSIPRIYRSSGVYWTYFSLTLTPEYIPLVVNWLPRDWPFVVRNYQNLGYFNMCKHSVIRMNQVNRGSSVSELRVGRSIHDRSKDYFSSLPRLALEPTQPITGGSFLRVKGPGREMATYLHLGRRLRMRGAILSLRHTSPCRSMAKRNRHMSYILFNSPTKSRDSSVVIALGYGLDNRGSRVRFPVGAGNFSLHHRVQSGSGAHPAPIQWVPGALSLGVKWPGNEADHSFPSSAEVKDFVELYLHSPIRLHGVVPG